MQRLGHAIRVALEPAGVAAVARLDDDQAQGLDKWAQRGRELVRGDHVLIAVRAREREPEALIPRERDSVAQDVEDCDVALPQAIQQELARDVGDHVSLRIKGEPAAPRGHSDRARVLGRRHRAGRGRPGHHNPPRRLGLAAGERVVPIRGLEAIGP